VTQVKTGQSATLTVSALPGKTFDGTVTAVGELGTSSSGSVSYPVTVKITKPTGILLGMSANVTIDTGTVSDATYIPTSAIENVNGVDEVMIPRSALPTSSSPFGGGGFGGGGFGGGGFGGGGDFGGASGFGGSSSFHRVAAKIDKTIPVSVTVKVGLSNGTDTEILSGLDGAKQVLEANPADTSTTTTSGAGHFGGFGGFGGGF
jgi:HlyD family secretion protein